MLFAAVSAAALSCPRCPDPTPHTRSAGDRSMPLRCPRGEHRIPVNGVHAQWPKSEWLCVCCCPTHDCHGRERKLWRGLVGACPCSVNALTGNKGSGGDMPHGDVVRQRPRARTKRTDIAGSHHCIPELPLYRSAALSAKAVETKGRDARLFLRDCFWRPKSTGRLCHMESLSPRRHGPPVVQDL